MHPCILLTSWMNSHGNRLLAKVRQLATRLARVIRPGMLSPPEQSYANAAAVAVDPLAVLQAAAQCFAKAGELVEALRAHQAALQISPASPHDLFRAGELLGQLGRYDEALPYFEHACERQPALFERREVLGRIHWIVQDRAAAERVWRAWRVEQDERARERGIDPGAFRVLGTNWTGWLGNNAHLDAYIKLGLLGWRQQIPLKLLAPEGRTANYAYARLWSAYVELVTDPPEVERLAALEGLIGDSLYTMEVRGIPTYYPHAIALAQDEWERQGRHPLLGVSAELVARGRAELERLGVPSDAWFACLHVRELGFWAERNDPTNSPRVARVESYFPALRAIVSAGGYVVRLGDPSMRPLPPMGGVVDYALSDAKSDWMDVFLSASCRFLVGTNSALYQTAISFGVPAVATNWMPLSSFPMQRRDIVLPKLLRSRDSGRMLTFADMLALPRDVWSGYLYQHHGLDVVDNTADEILEAVDEMLAKLAGVWPNIEARAAREERFKRIAVSHCVQVNGAIAAGFLARHADLLDGSEYESLTT